MFRFLSEKMIEESRMRRVGPAIGFLLVATLTALILKSDTTSMVDDKTIPLDEAITQPTKPGPLKIPIEGTLTYEEMFQEIGSQYGLDWHILEALAYHESRMDYLATGKADEMGLMQIAPPTWDEWAVKVGATDPFDPYSNILVAAAYLDFVRGLCTHHGHSEPHCMLVAYNWGPNRLDLFFEDGGTWVQIPAIRRNYAVNIIQMANTRSQNPAFFDEVYASISSQ